MSSEPKKSSVGKIILGVFGGGCLLVVVGIGSCTLLVGKAVHDVAEQQERQKQERAAAPISDIAWSEINEIYNLRSDFTELQKKENWKKYEGKKVQWTGEVSEMGETFGMLTLQIKMNADTFTSDLLLRLKEDQRSKAVNVSQGDTVTFTGILEEWGSLMPITLDDGEIVQ